MVLGFVVFWPIGLAILGYMLWSNEMSCGKKYGSRQGFWGGNGRYGSRSNAGSSFSSGNMAFDEYREATLKQLEEDQREFTVFIDQLRRAKDQREFDDFMSDRMRRKTQENGSSERPAEGTRALDRAGLSIVIRNVKNRRAESFAGFLLFFFSDFDNAREKRFDGRNIFGGGNDHADLDLHAL